jgi:hypothetical protein
MKCQIKNIWGELLFEGEFENLTKCLEQAVRDGKRLNHAVLDRVVFDWGASIDGARLDGARLDGASLDGARLDGARLDGASLDGASLVGARLGERLIRQFRDDLWAVLSSAPREAEAVRDALAAGNVNGSCYEGECACLVGTIANARKCGYKDLGLLKPDSTRLAEVWFLQIKKGDTPEKSAAVKLAIEWIDEWLATMKAVFAPSKEVKPAGGGRSLKKARSKR